MQFRINILLTLFAVFAMGSNNAVAQDITVSGTVVYASDHEPLAGAYVVPVGGAARVSAPMLTAHLSSQCLLQSEESM